MRTYHDRGTPGTPNMDTGRSEAVPGHWDVLKLLWMVHILPCIEG